MRQDQRLRRGHDAVDRLIVHLPWQGVEYLGIIDDRVDRRALLHRTDGLVEVAAAPAHPHAGPVDGGGWNDHEVDVVHGDGPEHLAGRLGKPEQPFGDLVVVGRDGPVEQPVGTGDRQQHANAALHGPGHEVARARFVHRRQEARDGMGAEGVDQRIESLADRQCR